MLDIESLKILIAEDNDSDRLLLKTIIKKQGHQVYVAADGIEAVNLFKEVQPDIILLDALMPNLDGFGAAEQIKGLSGQNFVPIIFLTSLKDTQSLVKCLEVGGDDFLSKPYNQIILHAKIKAFARMKNLQATVIEQRDKISSHMDHLIREQEVAKLVFDNIAHPGCINAPNIKCLLSPMAVFNGDLALASMKPSGGMYVLLGDFTGHGLPAAIGAMPVSEIFYGMTKKGFTIEEILREINKKLKGILPTGVFCCCCMADFDFRDEMVKVWVGGLPDIYIFSESSRSVTPISSKNLPLGVLSDDKFVSKTEIYHISYGDRMYLWSDGIHEAENAEGEMFGQNALAKVFENNTNPDTLFDEITDGVDQFTNKKDQDDDHTLVEVTMVKPDVFERHEDAIDDDVSLAGPIMDWTFSYELRAESLKTFNPLPLLTHILMEVPGLRPHSGHLYTILAELYSNALEHGILRLDSQLKNSSTGFAQYYKLRTERLNDLSQEAVTFTLDHRPNPVGGELVIIVKDDGTGFDYMGKMDNAKPSCGYSGRGISLIKTLCSSVEYKGNGNMVEVHFPWQYVNNG